MKKMLLACSMVLTALHGLAQGTVFFSNRAGGTVATHVYAPQMGYFFIHPLIGNGPGRYAFRDDRLVRIYTDRRQRDWRSIRGRHDDGSVVGSSGI